MFSFNLDRLLDCFAVSKLRLRQIDGSTEASFQLGYNDVKMNIAQTGNGQLLGFRIVLILQCQIFLKKPRHTAGNLILVTLCAGRNCHRHIRLRI